jgi:hypothetical protein
VTGALLYTVTSTATQVTFTPAANNQVLAQETAKTPAIIQQELAAAQQIFPAFLSNPANAQYLQGQQPQQQQQQQQQNDPSRDPNPSPPNNSLSTSAQQPSAKDETGPQNNADPKKVDPTSHDTTPQNQTQNLGTQANPTDQTKQQQENPNPVLKITIEDHLPLHIDAVGLPNHLLEPFPGSAAKRHTSMPTHCETLAGPRTAFAS